MNRVSQTIPYQYDTCYSPFKAGEFRFALEFLEEKGFTGVELAISHPSEVNGEELYKLLESHNLAATTLSTGQIYGLEGLFLSSSDEEIRKKAVQNISDHIDLSVSLNYPCVTIGLVRGKLEKEPKPVLLKNLKSSLMTLVEYAFKKNVILQLEPIRKAETVIINTVQEALEFMRELGDPENLGILYDTFHSNIEDNGMLNAISSAAGRITNVHFSDSNRGLPGTGTIDFPAVYKAIQATGYKGAYALETLSIPSVEYVRENCASSILKILNNRN
jgi:sugar phosphate isomerase/epimerase